MHKRLRGLKGLNRVLKRLADGTEAEYWYAWKGGPRLAGEPGSPEFYASYQAAMARRAKAPGEDIRSLVDRYLASPQFRNLAAATKVGYRDGISKIQAAFGDLPIAVLADRRIRGEFLDWRDKLGQRSPRQADLAFQVLARIISWGCDRGIAPENPCKRPGRLYKLNRSDRVWTSEQEEAFYATAPKHLQLALRLGLWTGQRQGDLLRLKWSAYDGESLRLRQRKTGAYVKLPVGVDLRKALDEARAELVRKLGDEDKLETILTTMKVAGAPWTSMGFSCSWRKACQRAGVTGVTFHDLRGTAVTRLAIAGCSVPEIATITGHSLKDAAAILERHYMKPDAELAKSAIAKLEKSLKAVGVDHETEQCAQPTVQPASDGY